MCVNINKTGRDDFILRVNSFYGIARIYLADFDNSTVFDTNIAIKPGISRAINNATIGNYQVISFFAGRYL